MLDLKIYTAVGVILALIAVFLYVDRMAYNRGKAQCEVLIADLERQAAQARDRIEYEVNRMDDAELEQELKKWYRD